MKLTFSCFEIKAYWPNTVHWEEGKEGKKERGEVEQWGKDRGGKGGRKEGKKQIHWFIYNGKYMYVCGFLS